MDMVVVYRSWRWNSTARFLLFGDLAVSAQQRFVKRALTQQ